jgi:DNA-binding response OmpR family regulator
MTAAGHKAKLLLVEDERHLAAGLKLNLELEGFSAEVADTAREAAHLLLRAGVYDVIILDVMLPDLDGFELCRRMREAGDYTPVIMLTARHAADDRVKGLEVGADDYLVKPFELPELIARVRSVLRGRGWDRRAAPAAGQVLQFGRARIDFGTYEVTVGEHPIKLTQLELDLVRHFADNPGRVISRAELLEKVWKLRNYPHTRTVDNFIVRLRKHFEPDPAKPLHFVSVRGSGYKFVPHPVKR